MGGREIEQRSSEAEKALDKVNTAFNEFTSLYSILIERGIEETDYGTIFENMVTDFKSLYSTAKIRHDALLLNRAQFEEGRLERDAFERSLTRLEEDIISAEFDIRIKILPRLRKVENELLQVHILEKIDDMDIPNEIKTELKQEAEEIKSQITETTKKDVIDQVTEYVSIGERIITLGEKVWALAKKIAPISPLILRIFGVP